MPNLGLEGEPWTIEYDEGGSFERFFSSLDEYQRATLVSAIEHVLTPYGVDICQSEWGKNLGGGLFEFRIRRSLSTILGEYAPSRSDPHGDSPDRSVLLRVFCTFHGRRVVLLLGGYDKGRDASDKRQTREIARARKVLGAWRRKQGSGGS